MDITTIILYVVGIGWAVNLFTAFVSTLNDLYWRNTHLSQGIIACLAFSWMPYFVFVAGLLHLTKWVFSRG